MSMPPTILPRDYLLVKQGASCDDGAIALVMIDGEVTVKRVFREKQSVVLKSDNPAMPPIPVREKEKNFRVLGKWSAWRTGNCERFIATENTENTENK